MDLYTIVIQRREKYKYIHFLKKVNVMERVHSPDISPDISVGSVDFTKHKTLSYPFPRLKAATPRDI